MTYFQNRPHIALDLPIKAGSIAGRVAMVAKADLFASKVKPMILELRASGLSLGSVAKKLEANHIMTASGKRTWTATAVRNALARGVTA